MRHLSLAPESDDPSPPRPVLRPVDARTPRRATEGSPAPHAAPDSRASRAGATEDTEDTEDTEGHGGSDSHDAA